MNTVTDAPRIYVACLASYNAGILHGEWIDLDQDIDDIWKEIRNMLASSPEECAEEWAIHDYEGFGSLRISEYEGIEAVHQYAEFILEHEETGQALLAEYCGDLDEAKRVMENFIGCYSSLADYAQELTEETTQIPENLSFYIDYEAMARDMRLNGDIVSIDSNCGEVMLFWNS